MRVPFRFIWKLRLGFGGAAWSRGVVGSRSAFHGLRMSLSLVLRLSIFFSLPSSRQEVIQASLSLRAPKSTSQSPFDHAANHRHEGEEVTRLDCSRDGF